MAVHDGRTAVGTIEIADGVYVALNSYGVVIGRFQSQRLAVRALPGSRP